MAKVLITALGLQLLLENESYKTGDFHQALLDIVYRRNRVKDADNDLYKRVNEMKVGDVIRYWDDIADVYDEDDEDGNLRQDIREAYDKEIDRLVGYGTLEPLIEKDDNGNDITWGYRKAKK